MQQQPLTDRGHRLLFTDRELFVLQIHAILANADSAGGHKDDIVALVFEIRQSGAKLVNKF